MEVKETKIKGLLILRPQIFTDERGSFCETYHKKLFTDRGIDVDFVQDNQSVSCAGVIRGLHLQSPPFAQGKLVRVAAGKALDVAVDVRKDSPTFGQYVSVLLSAEEGTMFWIPEGFAHGFAALENKTVFTYKVTNYYAQSAEHSIRWNDPTLNINWNIQTPIVSTKDNLSPTWKEFVSPF